MNEILDFLLARQESNEAEVAKHEHLLLTETEKYMIQAYNGIISYHSGKIDGLKEAIVALNG